MKLSLSLLFAVILLPLGALAQSAPAARQDPAVLRATAEQFLQMQTAGLPGQVTLTLGKLDARINLPACDAPQAFMAPGARAWGKTTVGLRCNAPAWTIYLQAQVLVLADYVASAMPLTQGQPIVASQLVLQRGDLATLPNGVITDTAQAIGRSLSMSLAAGAPLRLDILRSKNVVQQGQLVRVISSGEGFKVSAEARAIGSASEGQVVQVRTPGGTMLSGVAKAGGLVEVVF